MASTLRAAPPSGTVSPRARAMRRAASVLLAAGLLQFGCTVASALEPKREQALLHLLRHDCGSCHGMTLRGGLGPPLTAAALAGKPAPALEAVILFGLPGTPMPPWRASLSDEEARWLVGVLKSGRLQ